MFTDRFVRVPVNMYSQKEADLTGKEEYVPSVEMINPFEIRSYYANINHEDRDTVSVIFKDGSGLLVCTSLEEFEKLLNDHQSKNQQP